MTDRVWRGIDDNAAEMLAEKVRVRMISEWIAQQQPGDPPTLPQGIVKLVAEEVINVLPDIVLWGPPQRIAKLDD